MVYMYHIFFFQFIIDGHLGWFQVFAIVNSAARQKKQSLEWIGNPSNFYICFHFIFVRWSFPLVAQAQVNEVISVTATSTSRVQAILLPQPLSSWDYRYAPPCPANFVFLVEIGFSMLVRLVSNSWPQVKCPRQLPKMLRSWATTPGPFQLLF